MANYVLYHSNCTDGFAAAYSAWKGLSGNATFIPVNYSQPFPDIELTADDTVYLLDFCYPFEVLQKVLPKDSTIIVIDHHKTMQETFEKIVSCEDWIGTGVFDLNKSGAVLAWEWFMQGEDVPVIIQHVQDRDLWKFDMPATADVIAGLRALKDSHKFEVFDTLVYDGGGNYASEMLKKLTTMGSVLNDKTTKDCEGYARSGSEKIRTILFHGHKTALYNTTSLISDIGAAVLRNGEGYDVSLSFFVSSDLKMIFSLRSYDKGSNVDVSSIAKMYGGGGHRNAAGFTMGLKEGSQFIESLYLIPQEDEVCHLKGGV